ncbi:ATP-binding protein [Pseudoxanthomonas sacheonensis]|uniref:ATP-binding protein n=1 Tax=Pseudoxanthomonas sacheonensis TaxID=443615 RepID=UPI0013D00622|nr:ATP-binding protein [Pseudoxanthomonas sacheonensis]KAF1706251.1 oxidoreductase [Pseudoxanthomonas sacheonensis]
MAISLASISKTQRNSLPPRVVIHGAQKVGKSTFAAGSFNPIFLPLEDGLSGIETNSFPLLQTYAEVEAALLSLYSEAHDFGTVVVDSTDWLEPLIWKHVCDKNQWASIETPGYGRGYVEANAVWRDFLDKLNTLRMEKGMAIILIAHSAVKNFKAPDTEAFDRYELKMQKGALGLIVEWADAILFAQEETAIKKEVVGQNTRARGISTGRRIMNTNAKPSFIAGNRYSLPDVLPLEWSALVNAMAPAQEAKAA